MDRPDEPRPTLIAVTSQNWRTVTPHAGKTRRFLLFTATAAGQVAPAGRFDLPKAMTVHGWGHGKPHPLEACDMLVVGSAGETFRRRMARVGVRVVVAETDDPETAAAAALAAAPARAASPPEPQ